MKKLFSFAAALTAANILCEEVDVNGMAAGVDGFSKPNADMMKQIEEEEKKREFEAQKNKAKIQLQLDKYEQEKGAIDLRYKRDVEKAETKALKARTDENNAYLAGGVDTEVHKENIRKINDTLEDERRKARNVYDTAMQNLRAKNPDGYRSSRDW